jgi:hypothetical protein
VILTPKNWKSFQHYKDRAPLWIKLHRGLLDNIDYHLLSPLAGKCLPLVWLLASERDGIVPQADELAFRLRIGAAEAGGILNELVHRGFLVETDAAKHAEQDATQAQRIAASNGFGSRHISDITKRAAWDRDGGKCKNCGSCEDIEYDHVHPVSKGGNSELENVQLLCRPCNRKKRVSVATHAQLQVSDSRSLEKRESREEVEKKPRAASPSSDDFETLKAVYPRRNGNYGWKAAERKFNSLVKTGVDPKAIISAAKRLGETLHAKIGTEFIPMPASWLNAEDFVNFAVASFGPPAIPDKIPLEDAVQQFARTGHWSRHAPVSDVSQAPAEILAKHGLMPDGRRMQ